MKGLMTEYDTSKADLLLQVFALSSFCCPVNVSLLGAIWHRRSRRYHGWIPSPTHAIYTSCWSTILDVHLRSLVWQNHRCFSSILIKWPHGKGPNRRSTYTFPRKSVGRVMLVLYVWSTCFSGSTSRWSFYPDNDHPHRIAAQTAWRLTWRCRLYIIWYYHAPLSDAGTRTWRTSICLHGEFDFFIQTKHQNNPCNDQYQGRGNVSLTSWVIMGACTCISTRIITCFANFLPPRRRPNWGSPSQGTKLEGLQGWGACTRAVLVTSLDLSLSTSGTCCHVIGRRTRRV